MLLLTQKLKNSVLIYTEKYINLANSQYKLKLVMPEICYNITGPCAAVADYNEWKIRINLILLLENKHHFLRNIIPHEVAHLTAFTLFHDCKPHGKEWKKIMTDFNVTPDIYISYNTSSADQMVIHKHICKPVSKVKKIVKDIEKLSLKDRKKILSKINVL